MSFGNPTGPLWLLGLVAPAAAGTPAPLNQNFPTDTSFGTPTGGIPGYTKAGTPSRLVANQIIFDAPSTNTDSVFVVYKGGDKTQPNSIIKEILPGGSFILAVPNLSNPFQANMLLIDANVNGEGARVTCVVV